MHKRFSNSLNHHPFPLKTLTFSSSHNTKTPSSFLSRETMKPTTNNRKTETMVVLSRPALDHFFNEIPVVDLSDPDAKTSIVRACEDFGFFKVVNHGVPMEFMNNLEAEAFNFFNLPQSEKDRAGPAHPFGYDSKRIGPNGDVGWVEYILLHTNPNVISQESLSTFREKAEIFRSAVENYITAVKTMSFEILELMADGLRIEPRNVLSNMLRDEKSDSCFRLNHYPPCPELGALSGRNLIGFGEHTDPQIISVLRSNNTPGFQISVKDGAWLSVPADQNSFFINIGDSLQVLTNGKFKSIKHRVLADPRKTRLSMIFFGGPPLSEKIAPLPSLVGEGEESLYKEITWCEYKKFVYKSRVSDNRIGLFEKSDINPR